MRTPAMLDSPARPDHRREADPVVAVAVGLLGASALGLAVGLVLAVYDWRTPGAVLPLLWVVLATFLAAIGVLVAGAAVRWARSGPG